MTIPLSEIIETLAPMRGLVATPAPDATFAHHVWVLRQPSSGDQVPLVISHLELLQNQGDPDALRGLVSERFRNAEATLRNVHEQRVRDFHEIELLRRGWTPPPGWRHPLDNTQPAGHQAKAAEVQRGTTVDLGREGGNT